ncbi:nitrate reductase molybdenum cofactor assembly chaperone [Pseudoxanthobacter sp. M-2]|uniref:nitrate reductase molybdenum cofactor assembly chaperone n=1 Tax=Pseudoxanthobacter sp. M-2 TaxID=3078754 RepID=UPI0038FD0B0B
MRTLKVLSALLTYPTADLVTAGPELKAVLEREAVLPPRERAGVSALVDDLTAHDVYDAQERYILLFDRTRSLSLHLFEHVHGESRDRGQAMVDLLKLYEDGGYTPTTAELPDFLPLFLEYASTLPPAEAIELVGQPGHVFAALRERLAKRSSPYEAVFSALAAIAKARLDEAALAALRAEPDVDPEDLEALDAAWEEEEVTFGPGAAAACGTDTLAARLRQAGRPAPGLEQPPPPRTVVTHRHSGHA